MIPHHPRIRGEHLIQSEAFQMDQTSSPHSRGTPYQTFWQGSSDGIIPAFAGNTRADLLKDRLHKDHPRIRGEH